MKIVFVLSELKTHQDAQLPLIEEFKRRGIEIEIIIWHYGSEKEDIQRCKDIEADLFISDIIGGIVENLPEMEKNKWVFVPHGISIFKRFSATSNCKFFSLFVLSTNSWKDHFVSRNKENLPKNVLVSNGWSKMDEYFSLKTKKSKVKEKIYKKYNLKSNLPLVVYAPTGIRSNACTKEEWLAEYGSISGYAAHGSYFLKEQILKSISELDINIIELPHPCVERGDIDKDRTAIMVASDMLISDISSMAIEYLALDKPIILIKKPIKDFLPNDFKMFSQTEYPVLDIGDIISHSELKETIKYRLKHDDYAKIREYWKPKLIGSFDGQCAKREVEVILEWLSRQ